MGLIFSLLNSKNKKQYRGHFVAQIDVSLNNKLLFYYYINIQ